MKVSIIIPAYNEEENIPILLKEIKDKIMNSKIDYEIILVDDGSADKTYEKGIQEKQKYDFLKVVRQRHKGITDALLTGFNVASGDIFVYFPADLQYLPEDIPKLINKLEEGYDLVTGWKVGKYEKRFVSGIYNWLSRKLFKVPVHDLNSIKAFKKEVVDKLPWRKDWHRYMVVMAYDYGFNIAEVKVNLYPRRYGKTKLSFWRIPIGALDLIAVKFQLSFMRKPLLFFGSIGGALLFTGLVVGIIALYLRYALQHGYRPLLWLVIFLGLSGLLLFAIGFLAEAIAGIQDEIRKLSRK